MHSVSYSLVHRGAAVSAARWQPYASTSTSTQSYQNWTPNTPAFSLSSSPSTSRRPLAAGPSAIPSHPEPSRHSLGRTASVRDVQKFRYIAALVDQAVKSLGEIWEPDLIPAEFTSTTSFRSPLPTQTTSMPNIGLSSFPLAGPSNNIHPSFHHRNAQLPSPVTPSTQPSPVPPRSQQAQATLISTGLLPSTTAPLRSFVLEVLKRSKTSAGVLQTALCYIAAIAHKVPVLAAQEHMGLAGRGEPSMEHFITNGLYEDVSRQRDFACDDASARADAEHEFHVSDITAKLPPRSRAMVEDSVLVKTVKAEDDLDLPVTPDSPCMDSNALCVTAQTQPVQQRCIPGRPPGPSAPLPPLPPLPNPLLCPRRTFLAAVILASKFTQDKCFSNKAWARLAGLPAREISRCERALGAALDWRLWVGKLPSVPTSSAPASVDAVSRSLGRTKTIGDLNVTPIVTRSRRSGVGRSRTLPANSFGEQGVTSNATPESLQLSVGISAQDAARRPEVSTACFELPWSTNAGEGDLHRSFFGSMPMHASPATMSTPGLSYSPASTSSADPTPIIYMADGDASVRSPAVAIDGPWGLGGVLGGVAPAILGDMAHLGAGVRLDKPRPTGLILDNQASVDLTSYPHLRVA